MIRKASVKDAFEIMNILSKTQSPWSETSIVQSIQNENHTVLVFGDRVDGVLIFSEICGEHEVLNFVVREEKRREGIGDKLILELIKRAKCIYLDVRKSNLPAISIYSKHGFIINGERKNFYANPTEDAVLMIYKK